MCACMSVYICIFVCVHVCLPVWVHMAACMCVHEALRCLVSLLLQMHVNAATQQMLVRLKSIVHTAIYSYSR